MKRYRQHKIEVFADDDYYPDGTRYIGEYSVEVTCRGELVYECDGFSRPDSAEYNGMDWVDEWWENQTKLG